MQYHPDKNSEGKSNVYNTTFSLLLLLIMIAADVNLSLTFIYNKKRLLVSVVYIIS